MSVDDLRDEQREYVLRIEEVLAGMDRVLTDLANRVAAIERKASSDAAIKEHLRSLDGQITALGLAVNELMSER